MRESYQSKYSKNTRSFKPAFTPWTIARQIKNKAKDLRHEPLMSSLQWLIYHESLIKQLHYSHIVVQPESAAAIFGSPSRLARRWIIPGNTKMSKHRRLPTLRRAAISPKTTRSAMSPQRDNACVFGPLIYSYPTPPKDREVLAQTARGKAKVPLLMAAAAAEGLTVCWRCGLRASRRRTDA